MGRYDVADYTLIYVYAIHDEQHKGLLKVGKASLSSRLGIAELIPNHPQMQRAAHQRIKEQTRTAYVPYELLYTELATRVITLRDGSTQDKPFKDDDVHDVLDATGFNSRKFWDNGRKSEWYEIDLETAKAAIRAVKENRHRLATIPVYIPHTPPTRKIILRKEQMDCVKKTQAMFLRYDSMLWDCKMRFGKTVTAYELIRQQGYRKVIVITHRPAVEDSWREDFHIMLGGCGFQFVDRVQSDYTMDMERDVQNDRRLWELQETRTPFVYFASIQDLRGSERVGGKYPKNNGVFNVTWDLLIVDEAHEGTKTERGDAVISALHKKGTKKLSLTGTPYNILREYDEENRYTWTYVDEQRAKQAWEEEHPGEPNPYEDLPKMNIFTFNLGEELPASYRYVTQDSAFSFTEFFRVWTGDITKDYYPIPQGKEIGDFVHEEDVKQFLDLISRESEDSNYPFSCDEYREMFAHTFWIVPGVKEAKALSRLMQNHPVFRQYEIANIAGEGDAEKPYHLALDLVRSTIKTFDRTITISCGKLTTGVTVREWTGIMMLSGSSSTSAAGYMQAIFRVQSPGSIGGKQKKNCYVFDFAPDRTLRVLAEVHRATKGKKGGTEEARQALGEFINFCPIISVDGTRMHTYDVDDMMRQIKRISVEAAIQNGFEDDSIYRPIEGIRMGDVDAEVLKKLSDIVNPRKKGTGKSEVIIANAGMTEEQRKLADKAKRKPKKDLTPEELAALEARKKQKEEERKLYNLLRAVSIRLPLLFYGVDADITEVVHLKDFVEKVDDESWLEFMPSRLSKRLFLDILRFYDEDVVVGAGLRIRQMAKAADELPPTLRAKRIVEILSRFKNPDKETVLTPWRVVNMHMGEVFGGYNFYDEGYQTELEEPRFVDRGEVTADVFLGDQVKILEMNSKSGLYPLYMAYTLYMLQMNGKEKDLPLADTQAIWNKVVAQNIFVLCKTPMARLITIRTLVGYTGATVNAKYLPKLIEEWMKDIPRLARKLTNPTTWGIGGERMKFDCVVGNPPYQETNDNNKMSRSIYPDFVRIARAVGKKSSLIMPARWTSGESGPYKETKDFIADIIDGNHIKQFNLYLNSLDLFTHVDIKGGLCFYLYDIDYSKDEIDYTLIENGIQSRSMVSFREADNIIIRFPELVSILRKSRNSSSDSMRTLVSSRNPFDFVSDLFEKNNEGVSRISEKQIDPDDYAVYGLFKAKRVIRYIPNAELKKNIIGAQSYKVFLPRANGSGAFGEVFSTPILGMPMTICTDTFLQVGQFESQTEAENLLKYIKSKFFRAMVGIKKSAVFNYRDCFEFVPIQDFTSASDIDWSKSIAEIDQQLYAKYHLTDDEISFIETRVKPME